jgi:mono/diheme cytochrome c family protein
MIWLAASLLWSSAGMAQSPAGDAARGKHLFMADGCYECHGTVGQGGAGPRLAPDPLPAEAIAQYIRKPTAVMPPYVEKVAGDQDVQDIQAYLASIPQPPPLKDIPLLAP